jgi:hypothetical protein
MRRAIWLNLPLIIALTGCGFKQLEADNPEKPSMPNAWNYTAVNTEILDGEIALYITSALGILPKGTQMFGTYQTEQRDLEVCITRVRLPTETRLRAEPGRCLAKASPVEMPSVKSNGAIIIPQMKPFYLYGAPVEWMISRTAPKDGPQN